MADGSFDWDVANRIANALDGNDVIQPKNGVRVADSLRRIADAFDKIVAQNSENADLAREAQKLMREDLEFRRAQAEKAEQQQGMLMRMFLPPLAPEAPAADPTIDGIGAMRRKRRES